MARYGLMERGEQDKGARLERTVGRDSSDMSRTTYFLLPISRIRIHIFLHSLFLSFSHSLNLSFDHHNHHLLSGEHSSLSSHLILIQALIFFLRTVGDKEKAKMKTKSKLD